MSYYKVTRPDGASFHTDQVVYAVGKRVRPLPHDGEREICGPGVLHASRSAPEAAHYGRWPYRLWSVEGKPYIEGGDKAGFRQLTVVAELDVTECFGPQGAHIVACLDRISTLTADECGRLSDAWDAARSAARSAARYAARDAAAAAAWDAAWDAAWSAAWDAAAAAASAAAAAAAWDAAWDAASDAAAALAVRDLIGPTFTQADYDLLTGPWRETIGKVHPDDPDMRRSDV